MTLYRSHRRGTWVVKRTLLGVRIRRATGFHDRRDAEEFEQVLLKLRTHGRRDLLVAFSRGMVRGPELLAGVDRYGLNFRLTVEVVKPLRRSVWDFLRTAELSEKTRQGYRWGFCRILGRLPALSRSPTPTQRAWLSHGPSILDLPDLLARYARRPSTPGPMFAQVRAACLSFVRHSVPHGEHSDLWREVASIEGPKRGKRNVQGGLTPERAREVAEQLSQRYGAGDGRVWWLLCCTGMEPKECWRPGGFEVLADRIVIHGTKRATRDRVVPRLVSGPTSPPCSLRTFRKHLRAVGESLGIGGLTPYVARRTFAHWLELAARSGGPTESQCDILLGHSPKTEREKYREHDIGPYISRIASALRAVIGPDPAFVRIVA